MTPPPCMVWLPMDHRIMGTGDQQMPFLVLGEKYARAVKLGAAAQPVLFPLASADQIPELLDMVDGVLLTGSPANVHPSHFDQEVADPDLPLDPRRDELTLALVTACIRGAVPLLGLCRGFQEINIALGGSLHQAVHEISGHLDHREPKSAPYSEQYAPRHQITLAKGSIFETWAGGTEAKVNSLHGQAVARLAPGLTALATAPDGVVEGFGVASATAFAYAVQWHPEWQFEENPFYAAIFKSFGDACRASRESRRT